MKLACLLDLPQKLGKKTPKTTYVDECEANVLKQLEQLSVENALLSNKDNL